MVPIDRSYTTLLLITARFVAIGSLYAITTWSTTPNNDKIGHLEFFR